MLEALFIAAAAFAGALTQRAVGFGVPFFLVPVLLVYFQPPLAIIIFLLVATTSNLLVIFAHKDKKEIIWPVVSRLFITALPGLVAGAFVVTRIDKSILQVIVGTLIILSICIQEFAFPKPSSPLQVSRGINLSGFIAGFLNTSVGVSGAALILWFRAHICKPNQVRHNLAALFMLMNIVSFISIYVAKPTTLSARPLVIFAELLPVVLVGNFAGQLIAGRINKKQFERAIFAIVVATGVMSMVFGVVKLTS
jgi:uncharacterized membrane protein YfcA